jgi:hypothetical protein
VAAEISRNGSYAQRQFARSLGAPSPASPVPPAPVIPGQFLVDASTKESNELVVLLNYNDTAQLARVIPGLALDAAAPIVERSFIEAVLARSLNASDALSNPVHIRYVLQADRMSDADRLASIKHAAASVVARDGADPRERLERYMVVRYDSVAAARRAAERMRKNPVFAYVANNGTVVLSGAPNDAYFSVVPGVPAYYQWGAHAMNFSAAWDVTRGQSFIGILDADWPGFATYSGLAVHPDLQSNFRMHMVSQPISPSGVAANHTVHVAGIIAAQHNNNTGYQNGWVAGGCPECSFVTYPFYLQSPNPSVGYVASLITSAVDSGMQVINWSGGLPGGTCATAQPLCDALRFATYRSVLTVEASGNNNLTSGPQFPGNTGDNTYSHSILPVGGTSPNGLRWDSAPGSTANESGSNWSSSYGVMAPAQSIPSTFNANTDYNSYVYCTDSNSNDQSSGRFPNGIGDGVGSCTGTSMAAPHISALAGLVWSVNPRATASSVRNIIRQSGNRAGSPSAEYGYGLPSALTAVNSALAANPSRLTPLFSYYSSARLDSFYTTVPQMALSAAKGKMLPRVSGWPDYYNTYTASYGNWVYGYSIPQGPVFGGDGSGQVKAEAWIFTTSANPKNAAAPLRPLYRMSWKCGDPTPYPPSICGSAPYHADSVLVGKDEIAYFVWLGYKVDGLEGFIYPPDQPQPPGTVRLMRLYNADRDDHAMFPETAYSAMYNAGYYYYSNNSYWLGYVYPNSGSMPPIQ